MLDARRLLQVVALLVMAVACTASAGPQRRQGGRGDRDLLAANPARVVLGEGPKELSRVVFRSPPNDAFLLTNFGEGTLSLTDLDRHYMTFGLVKGGRVLDESSVAPTPRQQQRAAAASSLRRQAEAEGGLDRTEFSFREVRAQPHLAGMLQQGGAAGRGATARRQREADDFELAFLEVAEDGDKAEDKAKAEEAAEEADEKVIEKAVEKQIDAVVNAPAPAPERKGQRDYTHMGDVSVTGEVHVRSTRPIVASIQQWALVAHYDFESRESRRQWSTQEHGTCGHPGDVHLGGYCNFGEEIAKLTLPGLPKHGLVRVRARYHFIDKWQGEMGYAKVGDVTAWTETHAECDKVFGDLCRGVNVCGDAGASDRLSSLVEFTVPHDDAALELTFGSTLKGDPCDASWGVDDVMVWIL